MLGHDFYNQSLKRYVAVFGTLFNDILIHKRDQTGALVKTLKVPIQYGPAEKFLVRNKSDKNLSKPVAIELPRMSFEVTGMAYAGDRKLPSTNRYTVPDPDNPSRYRTIWMPVPYDINIQLNIMVKSYDDGSAILEQILPFFTPDWTPSVQLIDSLEIRHDIPFVLVGTSVSDNYEGDFETRRALIWTLDFVVKGYFFGPVTEKKVIKISNTPIYSDMNKDASAIRITTTPGMTANGQPTTNPDDSVDPLTIEESDDWGYAIKIEDDL